MFWTSFLVRSTGHAADAAAPLAVKLLWLLENLGERPLATLVSVLGMMNRSIVPALCASAARFAAGTAPIETAASKGRRRWGNASRSDHSARVGHGARNGE